VNAVLGKLIPERRSPAAKYKEAQREDLGLTAQLQREANSYRRDSRVKTVIIAVMALITLVLSMRAPTVLVYREHDNGSLTSMGRPQRSAVPDEAAITERLRRWIELAREVHDPSDADRLEADRTELYALTQKGSKANSDLDVEPVVRDRAKLGRAVRRNVRIAYVQRELNTAYTYEADFTEKTQQISGPGAMQGATVQKYHIILTIAKPKIATNEELALLNGPGVYVKEYDLKASGPPQLIPPAGAQ
jgi:type IV secretory pathway TrbF-like protein